MLVACHLMVVGFQDNDWIIVVLGALGMDAIGVDEGNLTKPLNAVRNIRDQDECGHNGGFGIMGRKSVTGSDKKCVESQARAITIYLFHLFSMS